MSKMTKEQIQERQMAIMNRMSEMEEKSREANNGSILFTEAESAEYRSLVDESAGLSARAKAMASGKAPVPAAPVKSWAWLMRPRSMLSAR